MRHFMLSTIALAALTGSALAADLPSTKAPPVYVPPAPIFSWTGFYIGADVGGGFGNAKFTTAAGSASLNTSGVVGGGFVGYNYQINQFVLGLQGDYQGAGISGSTTTPLSIINGRQDYLAAFNGRLGLAYDRALFYAIGGVAFTNTRSNIGLNINGVQVGSVGYSHSWTGYDIGAGVEYAFTNNWTGRVEYRYYDFGAWDYPAVLRSPAGRATLNDNTITVGLAYKFGAPEPVAVAAKY
jgi:outer membrane immunogenic protein